MEIDDLIAAIKKAFEVVVYPGDDNLYVGCDPDGIPERLGGKIWRDLKLEDLPYGVFPRFSDQALIYFLPAYLIAILRDPVKADYMSEGVLAAFSPESGYWYSGNDRHLRLAALLSTEQRQVLAEYFKLEKKRSGEVWDNEYEPAISFLQKYVV